MAYQGTTQQRGKVECLAKIQGAKLVGTKIKAPFSHYGDVYVLPMETVLATKVGNGSNVTLNRPWPA